MCHGEVPRPQRPPAQTVTFEEISKMKSFFHLFLTLDIMAKADNIKETTVDTANTRKITINYCSFVIGKLRSNIASQIVSPSSDLLNLLQYGFALCPSVTQCQAIAILLAHILCHFDEDAIKPAAKQDDVSDLDPPSILLNN